MTELAIDYTCNNHKWKYGKYHNVKEFNSFTEVRMCKKCNREEILKEEKNE